MGFKPTSKNRSIQGVQNKIPSFRIFFFQKRKYYLLHPILIIFLSGIKLLFYLHFLYFMQGEFCTMKAGLANHLC